MTTAKHRASHRRRRPRGESDHQDAIPLPPAVKPGELASGTREQTGPQRSIHAPGAGRTHSDDQPRTRSGPQNMRAGSPAAASAPAEGSGADSTSSPAADAPGPQAEGGRSAPAHSGAPPTAVPPSDQQPEGKLAQFLRFLEGRTNEWGTTARLLVLTVTPIALVLTAVIIIVGLMAGVSTWWSMLGSLLGIGTPATMAVGGVLMRRRRTSTSGKIVDRYESTDRNDPDQRSR